MTTNVPGPRFPLYVLGKRMVSAYAYVPIAGGTRCSIGIFSYQNTMTFGLNADFDGYPDVDVLAEGICRGDGRARRGGCGCGAAPAASTPKRNRSTNATATSEAPLGSRG